MENKTDPNAPNKSYMFGDDPPPPSTPTPEEILRQVGHLYTAYHGVTLERIERELEELMEMYDQFLK